VRRIATLMLGVLLGLPGMVIARTVRAHLGRPARAFQVRVSPFTIPAHQEREVCQAIVLSNRASLDVDALQFATPVGHGYITHHFALFVDDNDDLASLPKGPVDAAGCVGFGQNFGAILGGVQAPRAAISFPAGVGFTFQPHQILLLNLHYINGTAEPLRVDGAVNLLRARPGSILHHAHGFQFGTFRIDVPAGQDGSAEARWIAPVPMNVVFLSTHSHKHTTSVDVDVLRAGGETAQVLETVDYQHPTMERFTTPMRIATGDGFRWTCHYYNDTTKPLTFGITSEDEMCFTIGSFYLDDDTAPLPSVPGCFGGDVALTCPGQ
jgi:hypothetical protein